MSGLIIAFLLGALAMGLTVLIYLRHLNKKLMFELKLQLLANGEDPALVDEWIDDIPPWWKRGNNR